MKKMILFVIVVLNCLSCSAQTDKVIFGDLLTIGIFENNKIQLYYRDVISSRPDSDFANWEFSNWQKSDVADFILPEGYKYILDVSRTGEGLYYIMILVDNRTQLYSYENSNWQIVNERDITLPEKYKYCFLDNYSLQFYVFFDNEFMIYNIYNNRQVGNSYSLTLPNGYKNVFPKRLSNPSYNNSFIGVYVNDRIQFYRPVDGWQVFTEINFNLPRGSKSVFNIRNGFGVLVNNKVQFYLFNFDWGNIKWLEMTDWLFVLPE
jgi:hypothetical protein